MRAIGLQGSPASTLDSVDEDIETCRRIGVEVICFGLMPFSTEISVADPGVLEKPALVFGSTKLLSLRQSGHLPAAWKLCYDEQSFDQSHWLPRLQERALNSGAFIAPVSTIMDRHFPTDKFIKPTSDSKQFAGVIVRPDQTLRSVLEEQHHEVLAAHLPVLVAPRRKILAEYRCFMHRNRMFAASGYRLNDRTRYWPLTDFGSAMLRAETGTLAELYQPAEFYVVDLASTENGLVVVEYNCLNCSGKYAIGREQFFRYLLDHM